MKANKSKKEIKKEMQGPVELTGKVVQKKYAEGSKSEHHAVYLETDKGAYKLRRLGGNAFFDPELNKLVGKEVTATGTVNDALFLCKSVTKIPSAE